MENKKKEVTEDNGNINSDIERRLSDLIKMCLHKGSPFMLITQESENAYRSLVVNEGGAGTQFKLIRTMARAGDLDSFFRQVLEDANNHGHDSAFIKAMGVAYEPLN